MKSSSKKIIGFSVKQFVWFIIGLLIILTAICFLVLGLIEEYANVKNSIFTIPNSSMKSIFGGVGFVWFGIIFVCVGSVILAFALSLSAKNEERELEKEARRKQRLEQINNNKINLDVSSSTIVNSEKK